MTDLKDILDLDDRDAGDFLDGIQGNIVKSHGRRCTAHVLLRMTGDAPAVRRWIAEYASTDVTSAGAARQQAATRREYGGAGEPFAMFLLAPDGYRYLNEDLPSPPDGQIFTELGRQHFQRGMKPADLTGWEEPYQGRIDAMVLLADDDEARLDASVTAVAGRVAGVFDVLVTERGKGLKHRFPRGELSIEHFGYQDGVSQPIMIQQDLDAEIAERGATHWNPKAALSLAFTLEAGGGHGSFMVFRKLEQDVRAFGDAVDELAALSGVSADEAGAMAVGRFKDGTPVVPTAPVDPQVDMNDFEYEQDRDGARCPLHAHVRKTNPRGDIVREGLSTDPEFERGLRIVRRGIPYGDRPDLSEGAPQSDAAGLLFMCFQANLHQFVIQQDGSDANGFVKDGVGVDAVIGNNADAIEQTWPSTGTVKFTMANFVTLRGGEYFFAPSIAFLKGLAG